VRSPYTTKQQMMYEKCPCDLRKQPSAELLDQIADEKLTGRYNPNSICPTCNIARSRNGKCSQGCDD